MYFSELDNVVLPIHLNVMIWMDVRVCFPFTLLAIGLCCMVHFYTLPVTYYLKPPHCQSNPVYHTDCCHCSISTFSHKGLWWVSLYFRMMIALERFFFISWPQLNFFRQSKDSVIISVLIWGVCIVLAPLLIYFELSLVFCVFALIPSPILIFSILGTFISLPRATSVSAEAKRRIVVTVILLLINYDVTVVTPVSRFMVVIIFLNSRYMILEVLTLFLLSPFMDLFLFVFLREGPFDKLLKCLCFCKMETTAVEDGSRLHI